MLDCGLAMLVGNNSTPSSAARHLLDTLKIMGVEHPVGRSQSRARDTACRSVVKRLLRCLAPVALHRLEAQFKTVEQRAKANLEFCVVVMRPGIGDDTRQMAQFLLFQ